MPELPEVETTRRGIAPWIEGRRLQGAEVRRPRLRWPVPEALDERLRDRRVARVRRRGKYLLLDLEAEDWLLLHLGMSGSLRILPRGQAAGPHDPLDLLLEGDRILRLRDPRRFGAVLWWHGDPGAHPLLRHLGPEPLGEEFNGDLLYTRAQGRRLPVKAFLMDQRVVVGIGNIYANEALFRAGIHPRRSAGRISRIRYRHLAGAIRETLGAAIAQGGTTLKDFEQADGRPGYFALTLQVYGRGGRPCGRCGTTIRQREIGGRSSWYCPHCQH